MRLNFYDKSFYLFYRFYREKFGKKELPVLTSIISLAGTTFLQLLLLIAVFLRILKGREFDLTVLNRPAMIFSICLILFVSNSIYFFHKRRYYNVILKLISEKENYSGLFMKYVFFNFVSTGLLIFFLVITSGR